ncbi:SH3 domain-containing protein [Streptomyces qinglanensis]|uniref:SH3 domain-containing protein n=1 Tax=Streptomyces qinglanensis TaxID=943816 RepID=UPI003D70E8CF
MRTALRRVAVTAASVATIAGSAFVMAPTASAANSSSCTWWHQENEYVVANVNLRTGPSTGYTSKGILTKYTDIYVACGARGYVYVKPLEGAHKGQKGWVSASYVTGLFNY